MVKRCWSNSIRQSHNKAFMKLNIGEDACPTKPVTGEDVRSNVHEYVLHLETEVK